MKLLFEIIAAIFLIAVYRWDSFRRVEYDEQDF